MGDKKSGNDAEVIFKQGSTERTWTFLNQQSDVCPTQKYLFLKRYHIHFTTPSKSVRSPAPKNCPPPERCIKKPEDSPAPDRKPIQKNLRFGLISDIKVVETHSPAAYPGRTEQV